VRWGVHEVSTGVAVRPAGGGPSRGSVGSPAGVPATGSPAGPPGPVARLRSLRLPTLRGDSTPARLRRVGVLLVVGCLVAGVVSLVSGIERSQAVLDSDTRVAALTSDAAAIYQSLADADAMATSGYVSGRRESPEGRFRYDSDVAQAAQRMAHAASLLPDGAPAADSVATLTAQLPVYTGLIEAARTYNREGLPLGQSYLTRGSKLLQQTMLAAAADLRTTETDELTASYRQGSAAPWAVLLLGLGVLAAVVDFGLRERRRTNRVLNPGLVGCAAAVVVALLWWGVAALLTSSALTDAGRHTAAATALDDARTAVLKARSNESLVLVARNGTGGDATFLALMKPVLAPADQGGLLAAAEAQGAAVGDVRAATQAWQQAHADVRKLDDEQGNYTGAVESVIGDDPQGSGTLFADLDRKLAGVISGERDGLTDAVDRAHADQTLLAGGPAVLFLVAAVAAALGITRRTGEYR
jgi:hypothetical protein